MTKGQQEAVDKAIAFTWHQHGLHFEPSTTSIINFIAKEEKGVEIPKGDVDAAFLLQGYWQYSTGQRKQWHESFLAQDGSWPGTLAILLKYLYDGLHTLEHWRFIKWRFQQAYLYAEYLHTTRMNRSAK